MEHPTGFEPMVSELQSLALPLGYGCGEGIISPIVGVGNPYLDRAVLSLRRLIFNCR